jgi:hypothetical protein
MLGVPLHCQHSIRICLPTVFRQQPAQPTVVLASLTCQVPAAAAAAAAAVIIVPPDWRVCWRHDGTRNPVPVQDHP